MKKRVIPDSISARIPEYFYYAFGGEYVSMFGRDALIRDENGSCSLDYNTSTVGYTEALRETCRKLDMDWLFEYWSQLPWSQADMFGEELSDEVMKHFDRRDNTNPYYRYLLTRP